MCVRSPRPACTSTTWLAVLLAAIAFLLAAPAARAQCEPQLEPPPNFPSNPRGTNDQVYASVVWDPDGPSGFQSPKLVIGGLFTTAGGNTVNHVAYWDGTNWYPLLQGFNNVVYSLVVFNGELYAGGAFTMTGGTPCNRVAKYNPVTHSWSQVGAGFNNDVRSLVVNNGELCAGGFFTASGATTVSRVARFVGGAWQPLGPAGAEGANGQVYAIFSWGGRLYVGGTFSQAGAAPRANVAWWTAANGWNSLGNGTNGLVRCFANFGTDLVVGGNFTAVHGSGIPSPCIARFIPDAVSGVWAAGGGMGGGRPSFGTTAMVNIFPDLYIGGSDGNNLAYRWNGSTWSTVGSPAGPNKYAFTMTQYDGELVIGGLFNLIAGGLTLNNVARFHNNTWFPYFPRLSGPVGAFANFGGSLIIGGSFDQTDPSGVLAGNLIGWNNGTFGSRGVVNGTVNALLVRDNGVTLPTLVVGGVFTNAGGIAANGVAQRTLLEPATWSAMGDGFTNAAPGFNAPVFALTGYGTTGGPFGQPIVYAGGFFTHSGATVVNNVARFVSGAWQPLGSGANAGVNSVNAFKWVNAFTTFNGSLIVGGVFDTAGGLTANSIAAWNGSAWSTLGTGVRNGGAKGTVNDLATFNGSVIVGGRFDTAGGIAALNLARWDGAAWHAMTGGLVNPVDEEVTELGVHNNRLYAATVDFNTPSGDTESRLYKWNGSAWDIVGSAPGDGGVSAMFSYGGRLHIGGGFNKLGGFDVRYWLQLNCFCAADADGNGQVEPADVAAFVNLWFTSLNNGTLEGDFDHNGQIQPADVAAFVSTWFNTLNAGGC